MEPTPTRKAYVPAPPANPVVSVSRKAHLAGCDCAIAPAESCSRRSSGNSARAEMSTLPWRRWRSHSLSVSKCSPCGVWTTSPVMSCSMKTRDGWGSFRGGDVSAAPLPHLRSIPATRRRSSASCSRRSSMLRFFFAYYSPSKTRVSSCYIQESDRKRSGSRRGIWDAASAGHQIAAQGDASRRAKAHRAVRGGRGGLERRPAHLVRRRPQQDVHRESLRPRSRAGPNAGGGEQGGPAERVEFRGSEGQLLLYAPAHAEGSGRRRALRRELRRRETIRGGAGRFHSRPERAFAGGGPHGGCLRLPARQLRDRGGRGAAGRDASLRHRATRRRRRRRVPHRQLGGKARPEERAQQPGHRGPLHFLARDLRHDPPGTARPARRNPAHRRHPAHVRGGPPGGGGQAAGHGEALRYRQLPQLFRKLRGIRAGRPGLWRGFPVRHRAPAGEDRRNGLSEKRLFFPLLFALLLAARMCHTGILWEGDAFPVAAAGQMLAGKAIYRGIWFDKPPLLALFYLAIGARPGWALRLEGALYALLCCWIVYRFGRDLWSRREGLWAGGLLGFYLVFYVR